MTNDEIGNKIKELEKQIKELRSEIDSLKRVHYVPYEPPRPIPCTRFDGGIKFSYEPCGDSTYTW